MRNTALPIILIVVGGVWLAHEAGWFGPWQALFAAGLMVIGVAILLSEGINAQSIVSGPMLVYCGAAWLAYLHDALPERVVWPLGVVLLGVLLFLARTPMIAQARVRREQRNRPPPPPGAL